MLRGTTRFAFVFDQDGTLVRNRAFRYAYRRIPEALGIDVEPREFESAFYEVYYSLVREKRYSDAFDWEYVSSMALSKLGYEYVDGTFTRLVIEGINRDMVEPVEGAVEVLERIKRAGGIVYIFTNGHYVYQTFALRKTGLIGFVDGIVAYEHFKEPKPSSLAYSHVVSAVGLPLDRIFFVGDHPLYDVYGAINFGVKNLYWITKTHNSGVYTVADLKDDIVEHIWRKYNIRLHIKASDSMTIHVINELHELLPIIDRILFDDQVQF